MEWCEYFCIEKIMRTLDIFPKAIGRELYPDRDSLKKQIIDMMDGRNMYTNTIILLANLFYTEKRCQNLNNG